VQLGGTEGKKRCGGGFDLEGKNRGCGTEQKNCIGDGTEQDGANFRKDQEKIRKCFITSCSCAIVGIAVAWTSVGAIRPSLFNRSTSKGGKIEIHLLSVFSLSQLALASNYMMVEHEEGVEY
jgi:hypothetical protein